MWLSQAKRAQHVAARQRLEVGLLLRFTAPGHQNRTHGAVVHAHNGGRGTIARCDFLQNQR